MKMNCEDGIKIIFKALENDEREKVFNKWLHDDARYSVSFEEYIAELMPYQPTTQSEKNRILRRYGGDEFGGI